MIRIILLLFLFSAGINGQNRTVKTYYEKGKVESRVSFIDDVLEGTSYWYYKNGNLKIEKNYSNGKLNGVIREFYENGLLKKEVNINNGILDGVSKSYYDNGGLKEVKEYDMGRLVKSKTVEFDPGYIAPLSAYEAGKKKRNLENNDFLCDVDICPEPVGGIEEIESKIIYPKLAKQYKLEGSVLLTVRINRRGIVENINIIKSLGLGCDEAAIDAVKRTKFIPGEDKGEIVSADVTFKLNFKIDESKKPNAILSGTGIQNEIDSGEKDIENKHVSKNIEFITCDADECPKPVGGIVELLKKLKYPPQARRNNISGEVIIKATIDEFGFVISAEVIKGIGYGCDEAASSAIIKTQFEPAKTNGIMVESNIEIVVPFILN